jgi:hypothetical protein
LSCQLIGDGRENNPKGRRESGDRFARVVTEPEPVCEVAGELSENPSVIRDETYLPGSKLFRQQVDSAKAKEGKIRLPSLVHGARPLKV